MINKQEVKATSISWFKGVKILQRVLAHIKTHPIHAIIYLLLYLSKINPSKQAHHYIIDDVDTNPTEILIDMIHVEEFHQSLRESEENALTKPFGYFTFDTIHEYFAQGYFGILPIKFKNTDALVAMRLIENAYFYYKAVVINHQIHIYPVASDLDLESPEFELDQSYTEGIDSSPMCFIDRKGLICNPPVAVASVPNTAAPEHSLILLQQHEQSSLLITVTLIFLLFSGYLVYSIYLSRNRALGNINTQPIAISRQKKSSSLIELQKICSIFKGLTVQKINNSMVIYVEDDTISLNKEWSTRICKGFQHSIIVDKEGAISCLAKILKHSYPVTKIICKNNVLKVPLPQNGDLKPQNYNFEPDLIELLLNTVEYQIVQLDAKKNQLSRDLIPHKERFDSIENSAQKIMTPIIKMNDSPQNQVQGLNAIDEKIKKEFRYFYDYINEIDRLILSLRTSVTTGDRESCTKKLSETNELCNKLVLIMNEISGCLNEFATSSKELQSRPKETLLPKNKSLMKTAQILKVLNEKKNNKNELKSKSKKIKEEKKQKIKVQQKIKNKEIQGNKEKEVEIKGNQQRIFLPPGIREEKQHQVEWSIANDARTIMIKRNFSYIEEIVLSMERPSNEGRVLYDTDSRQTIHESLTYSLMKLTHGIARILQDGDYNKIVNSTWVNNCYIIRHHLVHQIDLIALCGEEIVSFSKEVVNQLKLSILSLSENKIEFNQSQMDLLKSFSDIYRKDIAQKINIQESNLAADILSRINKFCDRLHALCQKRNDNKITLNAIKYCIYALGELLKSLKRFDKDIYSIIKSGNNVLDDIIGYRHKTVHNFTPSDKPEKNLRYVKGIENYEEVTEDELNNVANNISLIRECCRDLDSRILQGHGIKHAGIWEIFW